MEARLNQILTSILALGTMLTVLVSCGGGDAPVNLQSNLSEESAFFGGINGLERQSDGSWVLSWTSLTNGLAIYAIYRSSSESDMSYSEPYKTTKESAYRYKPENVLKEEKKCFAVRVLGGTDLNSKILCNTAQPVKFSGITELTPQWDGSYILRWTKLPVDDAVYWIYERDINGAYNFATPSFQQKSDFFNTAAITRGESKCYVVRVAHSAYGTDENQNELCTSLEEPIKLTGKPNVVVVSASSEVHITWTASPTDGVVGYKLFSDNACSVPANCASGSNVVSEPQCTLKNLSKGRYSGICVIATDSAGRESEQVTSDPFEL